MSIYDCCISELSLYLKSNSSCWSGTKQTLSSFHGKLTCSRHDIAGQIVEVALSNNHSLILNLLKFQPMLYCVYCFPYQIIVDLLQLYGWKVYRENHWHAASHWQTLSHNVVSSITIQLKTLVVIYIDCTGSCKSKYHTITTTTAH